MTTIDLGWSSYMTDTREIPAVQAGVPLEDCPTTVMPFPWLQPELPKPSRIPRLLRRRLAGGRR